MKQNKKLALVEAPPFEEFMAAFRHYDEGATVRITTKAGTEQVQIRACIWTGGEITFQGYVPDDKEFPCRNIYMKSWGRPPLTSADEIERSKKLLQLEK